MKREDYGALSPGELVPTINGALAFVPHSIPRGFQLPNSTIKLLTKAEHRLGRLNGITRREVNPFLIGSPLLHREAIFSSRIEGTVTTPEQLVLLEAGSEKRGVPGRAADENTREVLNYVRAMRYGVNRLNELPPCLRLIKELHYQLMSGVRGSHEQPGKFRDTQNWIGNQYLPIEHARFVPPPPNAVPGNLQELEAYLNETGLDDALLIQLALIHYQFETIHPFRDGNGRIGRLLIPLLLCSYERLDAPLLYLSGYFERHRDDYNDLMLNVSKTGDWLSWINFFVYGVIESADDASTKAEQLLALRGRYHRQFQRARSSALLDRLVDQLFQVPSMTIGKASDLLGVTHAAAGGHVHRLESAGILEEVSGRKRDKFYVAREILSVMFDDPVGEIA